MKLTLLGSGDAFGSGGRLQTCYHVATGQDQFLIDCGATALIALSRHGMDPNAIRTIYISHLHGDHYSGLVWFLMHAYYVSRRSEPLVIAGPAGIEERVRAASEVLFPGSSGNRRRHELAFVVYRIGAPMPIGQATVTAYEVSHPSGAPSCALRIEAGGRTLAFSGDTEWVDSLVPCATGADLFIAECYGYDKPVPYHMTWKTLAPNLARLGAGRVLITHMNEHMLAHREEARAAGVLLAEDGLVVDV
ncbi:MAG: MBL fold metallo-hydrolase [Hyphomicrobiaceae bacterium]|nr:MBL fold metallo-hydrolase [Hyphomicrobiaceae bacterium]